MATLQRIRNRAGLLIAIVIGVALLAFILGDFLGTGNIATRRSQMVVAKINGESVYIQEYDALVQNISNFYQVYYGQTFSDDQAVQQSRMQAWDQLLDQYILNKEYSKLGVAVHPEELFDLVSGPNPHPIVRQFFSDPETQTFNRAALIRFLKAFQGGELDANQEFIWKYLEEEIDKSRMKSKFNQLFNKGIYANKLEAENKFSETNRKFSFSYVSKPYSSIPDSLVEISNRDLENYYDDHINDYFNENETRTIEYVTFNVVASEEDDRAAQKWINSIKPEFEEIKDVEVYVNANSDKPYDPTNYTKDQLDSVYAGALFNATVGTVYGPYAENNAYKLVKLAKVNYLPDSARARHILLSSQANIAFDQLQSKADSLMGLIKNGMSFGLLAEEISDDPSSAEVGGDLGWFTEGRMVKPFNDTVFYSSKGELKMVVSQYGIHIVEIMDQSPKVKKVQIGELVKNVVPSSQTIQVYYTKAVQFAGENNTLEQFRKSVQNTPGLMSRTAPNLTKGDQTIFGMKESRQIIRWAFQAEENDVSENIFEVNNNFIVAALSNVNKKGNIPLDEVADDIRRQVAKEKKGALLKEQMAEMLAGDSSLESIADKLNTNVQEAAQMYFANPTPMLRGAGLEPRVVGAASVTEQGSLSQPIVGNNGVYIIKVNDIAPAREATETDIFYTKIQMYPDAGLNNDAPQALKAKANIKDNRADFF
jgi:peptidyl-prolyl cis-trans isomerase D